MKKSRHISVNSFLVFMLVASCLSARDKVYAEDAVELPVTTTKSEDINKKALEEQQKQEAARIKAMPFEERFKQRFSLDLRNIDVTEALKYVSNKGFVNIVTTKNVSGRSTLTLDNVALKDIFDLILRSNALAYVMQGDIFYVMTEAEYKAQYGKNFTDLRQVKVFRLKYAIPDQAFSLLDALKSDIGRVLVDQESGNVLVMDTPERIVQIQAALEEFEKNNVVVVFPLKYGKAKEVEEILKTRLDAKKVGTVKADERNNQVVVQTLPERMEEIKSLVASLDKPTKEVVIDVKIIKISLSDQVTQGIEWEGILGISERKFGPAYLGTYPFSKITAGSSTPTFTSRSDVFNALGGQYGSYPFSGTTTSLNSSTKSGLFENLHIGLITKEKDFDALINFLGTLGKTRVLANPKIAVVNNQEAKIHIGERQAYVTTTTTSGSSVSTVAEEVQFVDVGIQISITPIINDDGFITMKLKPEISSVSQVLITPTNNKIPIIDTSLTETTVMMKDNTTLLIAGLRKDEKQDSFEQTPGLANIPILNFAFKKGTAKTIRTELMIMVTPHIITGSEFTTGNERDFGEKPGKEYVEYPAITRDKEMLPRSMSTDMQMKTYRDYVGGNELIGGEAAIKEIKHGSR